MPALIYNNTTMIKTYFCKYRQCSLILPNSKCIMFEDRGWGETGSIYSTANKKDMALIESNRLFKKGVIKIDAIYDAEEETITETVVVVPEVNVVEYPEIKMVQAAIAKIKEICAERGIEYTTIRSRSAVLDKAKELCISFPNLA